jgi:uncharacterized membrane protein YhiD involved in acid resistance
MLDSILTANGTLTITQFFICTAGALILGAAIAACHAWKNRSSRNFLATIAILPVIVEAVIMVVNGNLGAGVAVAGAFSLVRFRSVPGNSREIASVFLAMAVGLACGMGYVGMAVLLTVIVEMFAMIFLMMPEKRSDLADRVLRITIPENLDYNGIFDDIFDKYTGAVVLDKVKTVNMGSLYELDYRVTLKDEKTEKAMLDDIRCRNGNLTIVCGRVPDRREEQL